eukprot:scaffold89225_cov69-Phaeocystis_antarctica.AAC.2
MHLAPSLLPSAAPAVTRISESNHHRKGATALRGEARKHNAPCAIFLYLHCRRVVCAVLFRLFGTVGLFNKLQTQNKKNSLNRQTRTTLCHRYIYAVA